MQPDKDSRPSAAELLNMVKSENMPEDKKLLGMENIRYGLGIIKTIRQNSFGFFCH